LETDNDRPALTNSALCGPDRSLVFGGDQNGLLNPGARCWVSSHWVYSKSYVSSGPNSFALHRLSGIDSSCGLHTSLPSKAVLRARLIPSGRCEWMRWRSRNRTRRGHSRTGLSPRLLNRILLSLRRQGHQRNQYDESQDSHCEDPLIKSVKMHFEPSTLAR
jgi:hypothetical protein